MIRIGDKLPDFAFTVMGEERPEKRTSEEIFAGRKVVLFGLPGAFTPTCHHNHLPGYLDCIDGIHALGVDEVAVVSVNDVFVMDAWAELTRAKGKIAFLADGSAEFTKACGLELDLTAAGMGLRCQRFSMVVEDGVVRHLTLEEKAGSAERTGAAAIIEQLQSDQKRETKSNLWQRLSVRYNRPMR